jgi:hypothetical protein
MLAALVTALKGGKGQTMTDNFLREQSIVHI